MTSFGAGQIEAIRLSIGDSVRTILTGRPTPAGNDLASPPGDPGLFGPDSAAWKVHGDISMLIGGLRALLIQTLHPLAMAGVSDHSDYRHDPTGRLHRTGAFIATTTFASTAAAESAAARVRRVHDRVQGTGPDGQTYAASDPHLLMWVHATEVDSFVRAHRRYSAHPLAESDYDRYVGEMGVILTLLGGQDPPGSLDELDQVLTSYQPELRSSRLARDTVRFLLVPPAPLLARGPYGIVAGAAVGMLPRYARRMLWLPLAPGSDQLMVRPAAHALLKVLGWALGPSPNLATATARATHGSEHHD